MNYSRRIKQPLTLIEVVLSLGLASLLLVSIASLAAYMWRSQSQIDRHRNAIFADELLWTRLNDTLGHCTRVKVRESGETTVLKSSASHSQNSSGSFSYESQRLNFTFCPMIGEEVMLNLLQEASLYVKQGELIFETGPSSFLWSDLPTDKLRTTRVWLDHVDHFQVSFLYLPMPKNPSLSRASTGAEIKGSEIGGPEIGWNEQWNANWPHLPSAILIKLTQGEKTSQWPIWLKEPLLPIIEALPRESFETQEE